MKVTTTVSFDKGKGRGCWRVRFRQGVGFDTKLNVPKELYEAAGVSPSSEGKRAENIASDWAATKKCEFTKTVDGTRPAMSLEGIFDLMRSRNPEDVTDATWLRNEVHFSNLKLWPKKSPIAAVQPDMIDREMASAYRDARVAAGAKGRTIKGELAFLKQLLRFGFEDASRLTRMASLRFTKLPQVDCSDESEMVALTVEEFFRVLEATYRVMPRGGDLMRRRLIFGVTTMLRKTPLMGLRGEWVDVEDRWLDVPKEAMKGKKKKRPLSVPVCGWALEQLRRPIPVDLVWPNPRSGKAVGNLTRMLQKIAKEAGVREFSLHDLRATGNSWLANAGIGERIRQHLMGHAAGGAVISRYTKVNADTEAQLRAAVAVFDDIRSKHDEGVTSFFATRRTG